MKSYLPASTIATALALAVALAPASTVLWSQNPSPASQAGPQALPDAPPPAASPFAGLAGRVRPAPEPQAVTVLEDTPLTLQVLTPIVTGEARDGDEVLFLVSENVRVGDVLAIPRGASVHGAVVRSKKSGTLTGSPELMLRLVSLDLGEHTYPLYSHLLRVKGLSKTQPTERKVIGGAAIGAIVGGINMSKSGTAAEPNPAGMGVGAAAGAGIGTAVAAASPGPVLRIPPESEVEFSLASPITIVPLSDKEAARLGEGLSGGGPTLYVRGETP